MFLLTSHSTAVKLNCDFEIVTFTDSASIYSCKVNDNGVFNNSSIEIDSIDGTHQNSTKTHEDVHGLVFDGISNLSFFPKNIASYFKEVTHIQVKSSSLQAIKHDDLAPFAQLQYLDLRVNNIKVIEETTFHNNTELTHISLSMNQISSISSDAFDGLTDLTSLDISLNKCKTLFALAQTEADVAAVIARIKNGECASVMEYLQKASDQLKSTLNTLRDHVMEIGTKFDDISFTDIRNASNLSEMVTESLKQMMEELLNVIELTSKSTNDKVKMLTSKILALVKSSNILSGKNINDFERRMDDSGGRMYNSEGRGFKDDVLHNVLIKMIIAGSAVLIIVMILLVIQMCYICKLRRNNMNHDDELVKQQAATRFSQIKVFSSFHDLTETQQTIENDEKLKFGKSQLELVKSDRSKYTSFGISSTNTNEMVADENIYEPVRSSPTNDKVQRTTNEDFDQIYEHLDSDPKDNIDNMYEILSHVDAEEKTNAEIKIEDLEIYSNILEYDTNVEEKNKEKVIESQKSLIDSRVSKQYIDMNMGRKKSLDFDKTSPNYQNMLVEVNEPKPYMNMNEATGIYEEVGASTDHYEEMKKASVYDVPKNANDSVDYAELFFFDASKTDDEKIYNDIPNEYETFESVNK